MKIVALLGSGRRGGNTDLILRLIQTHLEEAARGHQTALHFETVYLAQQDLRCCRGCRLCFDRGELACPQQDDFLAIKAKIAAADGVIFASPVYVEDVSGLMKTLIDRLAHVCHRPQFMGKAAYLVATTGSSRLGKTLGTMRMAAQIWGFQVAGQAGFKMGARMERDQAVEQYDRQAAAAAGRLFAAIHQQSWRSPSFLSLLTFKIQQHAWNVKGVPGSVDYRYWEEHGWFNPAQTYFFPHRAHPLKVALARGLGGFIEKFTT